MISIYDWFGYDLPDKERYRLIRQAGFDGVLLWWSEGFGRGNYQDGPALAREAGLFIENIHAPIQNQQDLWQDSRAGEAVTDCYLQCVADCARFGIPTMVVHLPDEAYLCGELGLKRMDRLARAAERAGVNVALENVRNLSNVVYVLERVDSPRIGFCYDCCHHWNYAPEQDLPARYGDRLMALHLHDNGGSRGQHQLPFDGHIRWEETMERVARTGYSGPTALEPMNWDYGQLPPQAFLERAYAAARRLEKLRFRG